MQIEKLRITNLRRCTEKQAALGNDNLTCVKMLIKVTSSLKQQDEVDQAKDVY
jgi:hypothetical protein